MSECPECQKIECCSDSILAYDITGGTIYFNEQVSIEFVCPPGFTCEPGIYTIPRGRIRLAVSSSGQPSTLTINCCQSTITRSVPAGSTPEAIGIIAQEMVNACALQLAQCTARRTQFRQFVNTRQCVTFCATGLLLGYSGAPPALGSGYELVNGNICIAYGLFASYWNQDDANSRAVQAAKTKAGNLVGTGVLQCGYWNTTQNFTCPNSSVQTVSAFTYFSTASQAAADALALAAATAACPPSVCCLNTNPLLATSAFPADCAYDPVSNIVWVAAQNGGVDTFDASTHTFFNNIALGGSAECIGYSPVQQQMFVAVDTAADVIFVIDCFTQVVVGTISMPVTTNGPLQGFVYNPTNDSLYAVVFRNAPNHYAMMRVNCATQVATIVFDAAVGELMWGKPAYNTSSGQFWFGYSFGGSDYIAVSDTSFAIGTLIPHGGNSADYNNFLYVASTDRVYHSGKVTGAVFGVRIYDALNIVGVTTINTGSIGSMALSATCAVVTQRITGSVQFIDVVTESIFCSQVLAGSYASGKGSCSLINGTIYVTTAGSGVVPLTP